MSIAAAAQLNNTRHEWKGNEQQKHRQCYRGDICESVEYGRACTSKDGEKAEEGGRAELEDSHRHHHGSRLNDKDGAALNLLPPHTHTGQVKNCYSHALARVDWQDEQCKKCSTEGQKSGFE